MFFTDFLANRKPVNIRQHNIENGKVNFFAFNTSQRFFGRIVFINRIVFIPQINLKQICDIMFIINN